MNYSKVYELIISNARLHHLERVSKYHEKHHIIPRCIGGSNEDYNIVSLSPREHFVCHMLLVKIYKDNNKLRFALWSMCNQVSRRKYRVSSRTYYNAKINFASINSKLHSNKTLSEAHIITLRNRMLSGANPMKGKTGEKNPLFKRLRLDDTKRKISLTKRQMIQNNKTKIYVTPAGEFSVITEAAEANEVSRDTILYRCLQRSKDSHWCTCWFVK